LQGGDGEASYLLAGLDKAAQQGISVDREGFWSSYIALQEVSGLEFRYLFVGLALLFPIAQSSAAPPDDAPELTVLFPNVAPCCYLAQDGGIRGALYERAQNAFGRANIDARWVAASLLRILRSIESETARPVCGVGAVYSDERAAIGKFSAPLFDGRKMVVLARADLPQRDYSDDLTVFLSVYADQLLGAAQGASQGPRLDRIIESSQINSVLIPNGNRNAIALIARRRVDFFIVAYEFASSSLNVSPDADSVQMIQFSHGNRAPETHLWCNKATPDELIERINRGLMPQ
jgi:hypothetical protein